MTAHVYVTEGALADGALDSHIAQIGASFSPMFGGTAHIWLSGVLARPFVFGPVEGLDGWRESALAAAAMAPSACGLADPCEVELESDPAIAPALCTAIESALLDRLRSLAARHKLRIASLRPVWAGAVGSGDALHLPSALMCCHERDVTTILAFRSGHAVFAGIYPATVSYDEQATVDRLSASLSMGKEALRHVWIDDAGHEAAPTLRRAAVPQEC
jgi:hypothetical protein